MSAQVIAFQRIPDKRGELIVGHAGIDFPFVPRRFFFLTNPAGSTIKRGGHAHRVQQQLLIVVSGSASVYLGDGQAYALRAPEMGLHVPPLNWLDIELHPYSTLLVLASGGYDAADYVRERAEFNGMVAQA